MKEIPTIESVMTPFPHTIGIGQNLETAKELMREHGVRHLPVQDGGRLKGVVTDRDISFALSMELKNPDELLVRDVYTDEPFTVERTERLDEVVLKMAHDHLGCAIVVQNEKVIGIFTTVDACRTLGGVLRQCHESALT